MDLEWMLKVNAKLKATKEKKVNVDPQDEAQKFAQNKRKAEGGDVKAMDLVGDAYYNGKGVLQNYDEAIRWYKKAAERGNDDSMFSLGLMYDNGTGVAKNYAEAFKWYQKATEHGHGGAMNNLGLLYWHGRGVGENDNQAVYWMKRAMEAGNPKGAGNLGNWYLKGSGSLPKDIPTGMKYMVEAIKGGDVWSMLRYGDFWLKEYILDNAATCYLCAAYNDSGEGACKLSFILEWYGKIPDAIGLKGEERSCNYWMRKAKQLGCNVDEVKEDYEKLMSPTNDCFITTAVCDSLGKPDDCYELSTFRAFRDGWLHAQSDGQSLIDEYYRIAPKIVERINALPDRKEIYRSLRAEYLNPCLELIEQGKNLECKNLYVSMVKALQKTFL